MDDDQKQEVLRLVRTLMLSTALATVYQAQFGGMTGKEFRDLVEHPGQLDDPVRTEEFAEVRDLISLLITNIRLNLPEDENKREAILDALEAKYDEDPNRGELLEANQLLPEAFSEIQASTPIQA